MSNTNEAKAVPTRFTPEIAAAITSLMKATEAYDLKRESVIDALRAAGIKSTDFISPKTEGSTATPELNAAFKEAIVKGFPAAKRKLLNAPKGSLSKEQMKLRGDAQRSIGGYMGAFKRDIENKEPEGIAKAKAKKEAGRAAQQSTGPAKAAGTAAKVMESLQQAVKRARAIEEPDFDVVELVNLLAKAQQLVVKH
jgi:Sec-independent protein translocase protein TatA